MRNLWLDGGVLRGYYGEQVDIVLPDFIYEVGGYVFRNLEHIRSVVIPDGALDIGYGSFSGCTGLARVVIPDSIQRIDMYAFSGCEKLAEVKLPASLKIIRDSTFIHCANLRNVKIPDGVQKIEFHAFYGCDRLNEIAALGVTEIEDPIIDCVTKCVFPLVSIDTVESKLMKDNLALGFMSQPAKYTDTKASYAEYVAENASHLAELSVFHGFPEPLRYLDTNGLLNADLLPSLIATAQERGKADITAFLLDCQEKRGKLDHTSASFWTEFDEEFEL